MKDNVRNILKQAIRMKMESYLKENDIKYTKLDLNEKTQGELNAEKEEYKQRIATKQEQIKALNDQIKELQATAAKLNSEKPDEV